jgi:hypothetical protein
LTFGWPVAGYVCTGSSGLLPAVLLDIKLAAGGKDELQYLLDNSPRNGASRQQSTQTYILPDLLSALYDFTTYRSAEFP